MFNAVINTPFHHNYYVQCCHKYPLAAHHNFLCLQFNSVINDPFDESCYIITHFHHIMFNAVINATFHHNLLCLQFNTVINAPYLVGELKCYTYTISLLMLGNSKTRAVQRQQCSVRL
uniref:Uncharacterized protein n=1 Tax=Cacopsylla melanoneura TaxID=428564 RepID=A0A8D8ZTN8_9HEMI